MYSCAHWDGPDRDEDRKHLSFARTARAFARPTKMPLFFPHSVTRWCLLVSRAPSSPCSRSSGKNARVPTRVGIYLPRRTTMRFSRRVRVGKNTYLDRRVGKVLRLSYVRYFIYFSIRRKMLSFACIFQPCTTFSCTMCTTTFRPRVIQLAQCPFSSSSTSFFSHSIFFYTLQIRFYLPHGEWNMYERYMTGGSITYGRISPSRPPPRSFSAWWNVI